MTVEKKIAMTKQELITILEIESGDPEQDHVRSDDALLEYIDDPKITEAFGLVGKWYA